LQTGVPGTAMILQASHHHAYMAGTESFCIGKWRIDYGRSFIEESSMVRYHSQGIRQKEVIRSHMFQAILAASNAKWKQSDECWMHNTQAFPLRHKEPAKISCSVLLADL